MEKNQPPHLENCDFTFERLKIQINGHRNIIFEGHFVFREPLVQILRIL